jgi:diadenosine tetraphosphate (Ap4A) HIT family hydrolase
MSCIFCEREGIKVELENNLALAFFDSYPVNEGHMLIIPKRHVADYFEATDEEILAINDLLHKAKKLLEDKFKPDGFNIGMNIGYDAGQTIFHLHVHLIPRYKGDVNDPRGGIRHLKEELVPYKG